MFWFRLAMSLGRTVEELQASISSAEFSEWIAYANVEPFGYPIEMYRMGVPTSAIVGAIQSSIPIPKGKRRPKPPKPSDFYPVREGKQPDLTPEQREHIRKKHGKRRNG